jgi:predicted amidophosphoribosyltransferase
MWPMDGWGGCLDLLFPRACALCAVPLIEPGDRGLCSGCFGLLSPIRDGCVRCGAPMKPEPLLPKKRKRSKGRGCPTCDKKSFAMNRVFAYSVYAGTGIRIVRKMKEPRHEALAEQVGRSVADWLRKETPFAIEHYDAMIPIPQHWFRRLAIRYNQSEAMATGISHLFRCPIEDRWLHRTRWTPKQGMKTIAERLENMHRAFAISPKYSGRVQGRRFLLVDDVMTSGATLDQAAFALKERGAVMVDAVVFARGLGAARAAVPQTS